MAGTPRLSSALAELRGAVGSGTKRMLPTHTGGRASSSADVILARGRLEQAALTERYHYKQEVSRNRSTARQKPATGTIEFVVPFDGDEYFTRNAKADVERAWQLGSTSDRDAQIGHLLLSGHSRTNLGTTLHLSESYDTVPVRVALAHGDDALEQCSADRSTCVTTYDYVPNDPSELPVSVEVQLLDPDSFGTRNDLESRERIGQHATFQPFLLLSLSVRLTIQDTGSTDESLAPTLKRVSIEWPTITSLTSLSLSIGELKPGEAEPVTYNPVDRCIEWENVPMEMIGRSTNTKTITYATPLMLLIIGQPGELYRQDRIKGDFEVEILGQLLSGTKARLFDAHGLPDDEPLAVKSYVSTHLELVLDQAFARRIMRPYQLLHFDEVIPDPMRFTDIRQALQDLGYMKIEVVDGSAIDAQFVTARRTAGPDEMKLYLYIQGARYQTERNRQSGGDTYKSKMDSGELKVHITGELAGDSSRLTHEMNALQRVLREKFEHLRSRH